MVRDVSVRAGLAYSLDMTKGVFEMVGGALPTDFFDRPFVIPSVVEE
jgi:hypothetical protein